MSIIRRLILALALSAGIASPPAFAQAPPPVPAMPDTERRTSYSISASTCACSVGFALYGDSTDYANWLTVWVNGTQLSQSGNWTITSPTGPLATIPRPITDAVLTFNTAQTGTVQIVGARRPRRANQFSENRGVAARDLNQAITDLETQVRELWDRQARTLQGTPGDTINVLPLLASRQNQGACFDSSGNLVSCVSIPSSTFIAGTGINFTGTNPTSINANPLNLTAGPGIAIVANAVQLANAQTAVRQAILSAAVDATGFAGFANPGGGLNVNLTATATPLTMTFASGFNAQTGAVDFVGQAAADVTSYWSLLPANQYSFLAIDRNASTGVLTPTQTLMRPQRGPVFYAPRQALLHFDNNLVDDWGNAWASNGATFSNTITKFGGFSLRLNGVSSYAQSASIFNAGQGNWTIDTWVNLDSNVNGPIFSVGNGFGIFVTTNASGKLALYLSGDGATWNISLASPGLTTVTAATWHHVELTYDGAAYRLFLDGTIQVTVTSALVVSPEGVAMAVGTQVGVGGGTAGYWDEFDFVPFARNVAAFTPPTVPYSVSGDWFDTNTMTMKTATGPGPTWSAVQRLYVAEAVTGAATVSAVYNYSPVMQYRGADFAINLGNTRVKSGNTVMYAATPQFITNNATLSGVVTWVLGPSLVPPDAKSFYVHMTINHAAIKNSAGIGNQDCTFASRIPTGLAQNYGTLGTAYSNYAGMGTPTEATAFSEREGSVIRYPVINGIASLETIIVGTTCNVGGANAAIIKAAVLLGYDLP